MKINAQTALSTSKVLLVPYSVHQVPTYHEWMQDPSLQAATASEPLSLEEEYEMCRSWREDSDKLTFVICLPLPSGQTAVKPRVNDSPERMVGDINLFLIQPDSEDGGENAEEKAAGEIELMIARTELQRQGYGRGALLAFLDYILGHWKHIAEEYSGKQTEVELSFLRVKVNQTNIGSLRLFDSLGFEQVGDGVNYFGEIEMRWKPDLEGLRASKLWELCEETEYLLQC